VSIEEPLGKFRGFAAQGRVAIFNYYQVIENVRKAKTTHFTFRALTGPGWNYSEHT
jgi:hypothetical protein